MEKRKEKVVVIINQDSGYLMIDIANAFFAKEFDVHLITGRLVERNNPLNEKIKVTKIIRYQRDSTLKRLGTWLIGFFQILFQILLKHRKKKLLLVFFPPQKGRGFNLSPKKPNSKKKSIQVKIICG